MKIITEHVLALNELLKQVEIRDPIRQLINPKMEFVADPDEKVCLRLSIDTNMNGLPFKGLPSVHPLAYHQVRLYLKSPPQRLAGFIKSVLVSAIAHEIDESLFIDNKHAFPPTHWGPTELIE